MDTSSSVLQENRAPVELSKHSPRGKLVFPAILVVLGMLVMLYPVISTAWNNYGTSKAAQEYADLERSIPNEIKDVQWEKAQGYNENRTTGPILDPWLNSINSGDPSYAEYLAQLNATDTMARLIFPKIKADLPIFHGTSDEVLGKGLGHLYGSDLPVGGDGTHAVLTGHTGLSNVTLFDNLNKAKKGDAFYVQVTGHKLKYVVDQIKVVLPHETDDLKPVANKDYITLITCTPYGINTHRLLVRGHQVPLDPVDEQIFDQNHGAGWQWWMYALLGAVLLVGLGLGWWLWRQFRSRKALEEDSSGESDTESSTLGDFEPHRDANGHLEIAENSGNSARGQQNLGNSEYKEQHRTWERNDD